MVKIFVLSLFALPALSPLFTLAPTRSADGVLHLYRLVELDALWRQGIFFSRWFPDLVYGYGLPLFNYYAPLVYYLALPLHLIGIPLTLTLNLATVAAMLVGAVGMYLFAHALFSDARRMMATRHHAKLGSCSSLESGVMTRRDDESRSPSVVALAALVSALAFLYAPYLLFNALHRVNLAEQWALGFTPFALWRFLVLARSRNTRNWCAAVLAFAAVLLSHNVTGFLFAPLLLGWIVVQVPSSKLQGAGFTFQVSRLTFDLSRLCVLGFRPSSLILPLSAFAVALALAAFFWLPALLERDFVQIARVIVTPDFDYRYNFVSPAELVALLPRADTGRMNPNFPSTLGIVQGILSFGGASALVTRAQRRAGLPLFYLLAAGLAFTALMFAVSQPIWDSLPLLSFVQLPMRLRGIDALLLAPLAGWAILALPARAKTIAAALAILALVLTGFPMLYPRYASDVPPNPAPVDMFAYEERVGAIGTTSFGEYLPVWVQDVPDTSPLEQAYARNEQPSRFVVPPGVTTCGVTVAPLKQMLCADAPVTWRVIFNAFYFPGWRGTINDAPVAARPNARDGLITFDAPAGKSEINVEYGETSLESAANVISVFGALVVLAILALSIRDLRFAVRDALSAIRDLPSVLRRPSSVLLALTLLALALCALKFLYTDRFDSPFVAHFDGAGVQGIRQASGTRFGDELILLGSDVVTRTVRRGDALTVSLYWRAARPLEKDWSTFAHLTAPDGFVFAQDDSLHPANLPTTRWETDAYAVDSHSLVIPTELIPGDYQLRVGVYDPATNTRLETETGADYLIVTTIRVE